MQNLTNLVRIWTLLWAGILVFVTWNIWLGTPDIFPQIPVFEFLCEAGSQWDRICFIGLVVCWLLCLGLCLRDSFPTTVSKALDLQSNHPQTVLWNWARQAGWVGLITFGASLVCLNQHRLQAWFYQLMIYSLIFAFIGKSNQLKWLQRIVISIYLFSALGKLDFEFVHTVGQQLVLSSFRLVGWDQVAPAELDLIALSLLLPVIELSVAVALMLEKTRVLAGFVLCIFHLVLAVLLGQLQQSTAVVVWNVQFAVQALLLFCMPYLPIFGLHPRSTCETSYLEVSSKTRAGQLFHKFIALCLILVMVLPVLERTEYWDHWPSWALYAPHTSRVLVTVPEYELGQLPVQLQQIAEPSPVVGARSIPLARWSLVALNVPVYPQSRFQLGLVRHLNRFIDSEFAIEAELLSAANRFTGARKSVKLKGKQQIEQAGKQFWINSKPRRGTA